MKSTQREAAPMRSSGVLAQPRTTGRDLVTKTVLGESLKAPLTRGGAEAHRPASILGCIDNSPVTVKILSHPAFLAFLILVFVIVGFAVARWRYLRKQRSDSANLPTIPASEIVHPGSSPAPAPVTAPKHTPQEVVERALRRGDKALENLQGPSLPFLDTAPLAHQEPEQAEINTADGKQTSRQ